MDWSKTSTETSCENVWFSRGKRDVAILLDEFPNAKPFTASLAELIMARVGISH